MNGSEHLRAGEYEILVARFNAFYANALENIKNGIDASSLGVFGNPFATESATAAMSKMAALTPKQQKSATRTALRWHSLCSEQQTQPFACSTRDGVGAEDCAVLRRVKFVMALFRAHWLDSDGDSDGDSDAAKDFDFVWLFETALRDYDALHLLNDYEHLRAEHSAKELQRHRDCKFEAESDSECGHVLLRKWRRQKQNENENANSKAFLNLKALSLSQRTVLELAAKVHALLSHQRGDGDGDAQREREHKDEDGDGDGAEEQSKFVMDALSQPSQRSEKEKAKRGRIGGLARILRERTLRGLDIDVEGFVRWLFDTEFAAPSLPAQSARAAVRAK